MVSQQFDAKNDFYKPFYPWNYPFDSIFSKLLLINLNHLKGLRPAYIVSGPFRAILFICNQRFLNWDIRTHSEK